MMLFDKKIKTAWVSVFGDYEWDLIDKLRKQRFDINRIDIVGKAVAELEKNKYNLIIVGSELTVGENLDNYFRQALSSCKNEMRSHELDYSKISLYFIDRIKQGRHSLVNRYTPLVVMDNFSKLNPAERNKYVIAGTNNIINGKMNLEEVIHNLKFF